MIAPEPVQPLAGPGPERDRIVAPASAPTLATTAPPPPGHATRSTAATAGGWLIHPVEVDAAGFAARYLTGPGAVDSGP